MPPLDPRQFRKLLGCYATGITVVTTQDARHQPVGITINSFTSVSLEPPQILFCLDRHAHVTPVFRRTEFFAVNILSAAQENVSRHFATPHLVPQPPRVFANPVQDCPILRGTLGWLIVRKGKVHNGGDHLIITGEVIRMQQARSPQQPLLYFHSHYHRLHETGDKP